MYYDQQFKHVNGFAGIMRAVAAIENEQAGQSVQTMKAV